MKSYDLLGRVRKQEVLKNGVLEDSREYFFDGNGNLIKEIINGLTNSYKFDKLDELVKSSKYIDGVLVEKSYEFDVFGNRMVLSSNGLSEKNQYNDKNQLINTNNKVFYEYDGNGNLISKKHDGQNDVYTYNDFGQLTKLVQGQFKYEYEYDAKGNRTKQTKTDLKDYHYDVFFNYDVSYKKVTQEDISQTFKDVKNQLEVNESGWYCEVSVTMNGADYKADLDSVNIAVIINQGYSYESAMYDYFYTINETGGIGLIYSKKISVGNILRKN